MTNDSLIDGTTYWKQTFDAYKAATGGDASCAWEVMCYFAEREAAQRRQPSLCETLFGPLASL